ncbi:MAG TPA: RnfABCDGE type electron transport complex subunit D [Vineibacter sp.]|nr:RnfABCDGE type electron transport complex subunit D [Vineibacter sp.]
MGRLRGIDARFLQIGFLGSFLLFGALVRDFALRPEQVALTFAAALATQLIGARLTGLPSHSLLSAVVTSLGLSILVRADSLWVHPLVASLAIGAKFVIRIRGKHLYNPANLGVMIALLVLPGAWVSPGQWGSDMLLALWVATFGVTVSTSARRFDIAWAFLAIYVALLCLRIEYLGARWAVLGNQLSSGALILFTFFMITDPMTTPNHRMMRFLYAAIVAIGAFTWTYVFFQPHGPVWALFLATPLVPLLDRLMPAEKFQWRPQAPYPSAPPQQASSTTNTG